MAKTRLELENDIADATEQMAALKIETKELVKATWPTFLDENAKSRFLSSDQARGTLSDEQLRLLKQEVNELKQSQLSQIEDRYIVDGLSGLGRNGSLLDYKDDFSYSSGIYLSGLASELEALLARHFGRGRINRLVPRRLRQSELGAAYETLMRQLASTQAVLRDRNSELSDLTASEATQQAEARWDSI